MEVRAILDAELLDKLDDLDELDLALDEDLMLDWAALEIELRMELMLELDVVTLDLALDATLRLEEVPILDLAAMLAAELAPAAEFGVELAVLVVFAGGLVVTAAATVRTFKAGDASDALPAMSNALML